MEEEPNLIQQVQSQIDWDSRYWFGNSGVIDSLPYTVLCLCGESGELANLVKKVVRGSHPLDEEMRLEMCKESVDVFIYLVMVFNVMKADVVKNWLAKREELIERWGNPGYCPESSFGLRGIAEEPVAKGSS